MENSKSWIRRQYGWILLLLFQILAVLISELPITNAQTIQVDPNDVNNFINQRRQLGMNITYKMIHDWFENYGQPGQQQTTQTQTQTSQTQQSSSSSSGGGLSAPLMYPRLFPFCVTYQQIMNTTHLNTQSSNLYRFRNIFNQIRQIQDKRDKFHHFNASKHSILENTSFISGVTLSRINTPEPDMINLRQWAHVTVKINPNAPSVKGLYAQAIVGPLGLPMGEINIDFPCSDLPGANDMDTVAELEFCHYRPKAAIFHPKVYVAASTTVRSSFHFHYQWTDISCMETPYLQFLFIVVHDFATKTPVYGRDYAIFFSPVFENVNPDSLDGSPYPYHPIWKSSMYCNADGNSNPQNYLADKLKALTPSKNLGASKSKHNVDATYAPLKWQVLTNMTRIHPNEHYDACIRRVKLDEIRKATDDYRLECPPGPFKCDQSYANTPGGMTTIVENRKNMMNSEVNTSDCDVCLPPPCDQLNFTDDECKGIVRTLTIVLTTEPPPPIVVQNDTVVIDTVEVKGRIKSHGVLSVLAALVLFPIANFMGRHFKEVCRNCLCGNGPWIFVHIAFHFVGNIILWISVGPVVASISDYDEVLLECEEAYITEKSQKECATERSWRNPHIPIGVAVFVIENLLIIAGFFRSSKNTLRLCQLATHSHLGYLAFVLSFIAAFLATYNRGCIEIVVFLIGLFFFPIVFHVVGFVLDCMTDRKLGISPRRRLWPILEPVRLERRGPCECCKWIVFGVFMLIMLGLWLLVALSSNMASKQDDSGFDPNAAGSVSTHYEGGEFTGIFGSCGHVNDQRKT